MKIGFVVTAHHSDEFRSNGNKLLIRFCNSIFEHVNYEFEIIIVNNGSTKPITIPSENSHCINIEDQTQHGITGAWNQGIDKAFDIGCDVVFNCNDDLWFNDTINNMIEFIITDSNENCVYSALTNGMLSGPQKAQGVGKGHFELACRHGNGVIAGFFFGFTKDHYEKFKFEDDKYFNKDNKDNGGDGKWGGQEGQFVENSEHGLFGKVLRECFIHHDKIRGWKQLIKK